MDKASVATFYHYHTVVGVIMVSVVLSVCLLCGDTAFSAVPDEADLFEQAYDHYQARRFEKAAELFGLHVKEYQNSSVGDSALYWQAKSLIRLQRTDDARRSLNTLLEKYPESTFTSFARQELDIMKPAASEKPATDKRPDTLQSEILLKRLQEPDACSDHLKKAEDRLRSLKDQLADASARSLSLQNELNAAVNDKKYLSTVVDELRLGQDGGTKNAAEIVQLKGENERLQREINKLSARRQSADAVDSSKKVVEKQLFEDALKKNSALEQKIREVLAKSAAYIRQTDERIGKLEGEREKDLARLKEAEKRYAELEKKYAGSSGGATAHDAELKNIRAEKAALEKRITEFETALAGMTNAKDGCEGLKSENGKLSAKLREAEQLRAEIEVQTRHVFADNRLLEKQLKDRDASIALLERMQGGQEALQQLRTDTEQNKSENERLTVSLKKNAEETARLRQEKESLEKQMSAHAAAHKAEEGVTAELQEAEQKRAEAEGKLAEAEKKVIELSNKQRETQKKNVELAAQSKKLNQKKSKSESQNRKKTSKKNRKKRSSVQA